MSISIATRQAYTEIDSFINLLDEEYKNKIPQELREYFKREKDINYIKKINPHKPIKEQNLKKETLALIAMLNLQYWCEDEDEKERLKKIYIKNEEEYQKKLKQKYNPDKLFEKKQDAQVEMIKIKEETFFQKIKKFFGKLIRKLKKY